MNLEDSMHLITLIFSMLSVIPSTQLFLKVFKNVSTEFTLQNMTNVALSLFFFVVLIVSVINIAMYHDIVFGKVISVNGHDLSVMRSTITSISMYFVLILFKKNFIK